MSGKKHTKKYRDRRSPPYSANDFKTGTTKKGNDNSMYVVSSPNINGVRRWLKKHRTPHKAQGKYNVTYEGEEIDFPYYLTKPNGMRWIRYEKKTNVFRRRRGSTPLDAKSVKTLLKKGYAVWVVHKRKPIPASLSKAIKPIGEGEFITRRSSWDGVNVTFKPYYRKPRGDDGWIFWDNQFQSFRAPHHGLGSGLVRGATAKELVEEGFKVYVVNQLPDAWA